MRIAFPAALLLAALPVAAQAQDQAKSQSQPDAGQDTDTPRSNAIAAQTAPGVAAANDAVAPQAAANAYRADLAAEDQALYARDVRSYEAARRARRREINHDQNYYDRQQRAYAQAMADWRMQANACQHGDRRACNAPTPRPGDYM